MPYDNTNSGALFTNNRKKGQNPSDYNGTVNVEGKEYWLNGWLKTSKKGQKYMSLSLQPKKKMSFETQSEGGSTSEPSDEVPF